MTMEFNASEEWLRKTAEAEDGANINIGSPSPGPIIFFVTVLHDKQKRKRTWGWYLKFKDAEKAVLENHTDIFEMGYYNLAVISAFPEGVLAVEEMIWWYKATYPEIIPENTLVDPAVEQIESPDEFKQVCCLAIG
jgi:hypothetical protein